MKLLYFLFIPVLLCAGSVDAQVVKVDTIKYTPTKNPKKSKFNTPKEYSYTVGLRLFSYGQYPKVLNQINSIDNRKAYLNGLMFKFNDNQLSYRFLATYLNENIEFKNDCEDCEEANGKQTDLVLKIGFEKNLTYAAFRPYFGVDLGFNRNRVLGSSKNAGTINYTTSYSFITEKYGAIFSPILGVKYSLVSHVTLAVEASLDLLYSYERQDKTYDDTNRTRTFAKFRKWEYLSKPVSWLSLQYNFGLSN